MNSRRRKLSLYQHQSAAKYGIYSMQHILLDLYILDWTVCEFDLNSTKVDKGCQLLSLSVSTYIAFLQKYRSTFSIWRNTSNTMLYLDLSGILSIFAWFHTCQWCLIDVQYFPWLLTVVNNIWSAWSSVNEPLHCQQFKYQCFRSLCLDPAC